LIRHCYDGSQQKDVTVNEQGWQTEQFERYRPHLQAVAYRMLGSVSEAEDAVQEAWLRLSRSDSDAVANLAGWLTTVVGRVCLDALRSRRSRREDYVGSWPPEPIVSLDERHPIPTLRSSARSSTPFSPRPGQVISTRCLPCSTPTSSSGSMAAASLRAGGRPSSAPKRLRITCSSAQRLPGMRGRRSSTVPPVLVVAPFGRPISVVGFTVARGRIVAIDIIADPTKLGGLAGDARTTST
jgi:RNA polymerase sigma factor (sigma-70 family)